MGLSNAGISARDSWSDFGKGDTNAAVCCVDSILDASAAISSIGLFKLNCAGLDLLIGVGGRSLLFGTDCPCGAQPKEDVTSGVFSLCGATDELAAGAGYIFFLMAILPYSVVRDTRALVRVDGTVKAHATRVIRVAFVAGD